MESPTPKYVEEKSKENRSWLNTETYYQFVADIKKKIQKIVNEKQMTKSEIQKVLKERFDLSLPQSTINGCLKELLNSGEIVKQKDGRTILFGTKLNSK